MRRYLSLLGLAVLAASGDGPGSRRPHRRPRRDALAARRDEQHDDALVRRRERPVAGRPHRLGHDDPDPVGRRGGQRARRAPAAAAAPPRSRRPAAPPADGRLHGAPRRLALGDRRRPPGVPDERDRRDERARSQRRPARGHRAQAADRLARAGRAPRSPRPRRRACRRPRRTPRRAACRPRDIAAVATRNGVPASLASAIAWQERGFNNAMVSSANARGVMQVMPGTWNWVQANLARRQLDPTLGDRQRRRRRAVPRPPAQETGGDPALAAAGYYQGIGSVRSIGMLPGDPALRRQRDGAAVALRGVGLSHRFHAAKVRRHGAANPDVRPCRPRVLRPVRRGRHRTPSGRRTSSTSCFAAGPTTRSSGARS